MAGSWGQAGGGYDLGVVGRYDFWPCRGQTAWRC